MKHTEPLPDFLVPADAIDAPGPDSLDMIDLAARQAVELSEPIATREAIVFVIDTKLGSIKPPELYRYIDDCKPDSVINDTLRKLAAEGYVDREQRVWFPPGAIESVTWELVLIP